MSGIGIGQVIVNDDEKREDDEKVEGKCKQTSMNIPAKKVKRTKAIENLWEMH